ncbi:MAG: hypothetical protein WCS36_04700 [Candidatus Neomarinimicrobiota bacterium]|nr:hypothetical protein [Candidatus Neomarinimicrobiota bacterium]
MSTENLISVEVTPEDKEAIEAAIRVLEDKLMPYLTALTPAQRKSLPKMSDKTTPFVDKVKEYFTTAPEFIPAFVSLPEFNKDYEANAMLTSFLRKLEPVIGGLDDTRLLTGSECYKPALAYYNSVKVAANMNVQAAKEIYNELKKRFEGQGKAPEETTPPTA